MTIAIIGAGMAGLSAARDLVGAGYKVRLFDKGRGPGGRMSTRRVDLDDTELRFDHGAQYLTAKTDAFQTILEQWVTDGAAADWSGDVVHLDETGRVMSTLDQKRYVGVPGMNGIIRHLATDLDVTWSARVAEITKSKGKWQLRFEGGVREDGFDAVIIAVPAEQVAPLVAACAPFIASAASKITSDACWTTLVAFTEPVPVEWRAALTKEPAIAWVADNGSKPGRSGGATWVLQASADWSQTHLEDEQEGVAAAMIEAFQNLTRAGEVTFSAAHRWRYSQVRTPAPQHSFWSHEDQIGVCGDWCSGPTAEDSWSSARALTAQIIKD